MTEELRVETTGETVGEAKWAAFRELERLYPALDRAAVRFQVVSEGERGLLGVGYAPARVVATVEGDGEASGALPPVEESEAATLVRELVVRITGGLGISCRVDVVEEGEAVVATCLGGDLGLLIGRHGHTIDAVQYLVNAILTRRVPGRSAVVDAAGYRARREASLAGLALRAADRARRDGERVELEPMTAVERKIVHLRLRDVDGVATTSEGTEPNRFVVVFPAGGD
ncbi:MAG: KH domain-containing protein [Actinomycetota bacterium]|nr:KH domain-containing protein [Actinomycetota bacterium]